MGYEIVYHFHSTALADEEDQQEEKSGSVKVGTPYEEVSLEVLAGKVMALMARRNIFVTRVELYEIVKKPITFKESEDGIIIKNKKFKFDDGPQISGQDYNEASSGSQGGNQGQDGKSLEDLQALLAKNPQLISLLQNGQKPLHPHELVSKPPASTLPAAVPAGTLRNEFYYPDDMVWVEQAKAVNPDHAFTEGKKYPILGERKQPAASMGGTPVLALYYETIDDKGRKQLMNSKLFSPTIPMLDGQGVDQRGLTDQGLSWSGANVDDMPDLRRRK